MKKAFIVLLLSFIKLSAQESKFIDQYIGDVMSNHSIQGLSAIVIKDGNIIWAKGYGYADVEKNIPFTRNTINAEVASVSKTITATALMQLWEKDSFELDDPINKYLPFKVINPYFPDAPITFKMLLTHTSSLNANYDIGDQKFDFNGKYFPALGKHLYEMLNASGDYYIDTITFNKSEPGKNWYYSGAGYALIGYLVEVISKMPFEVYCNKNIFIPLGMNHTGWHFRDVDTNIVSRPYQWDDSLNTQADCGLYEYPTYPEGQLKSSVVDMSKFLWMIMNRGQFGDKVILKSETVKLMLSVQVRITDSTMLDLGYGYGWGHAKINHDNLWGHHGRDMGIGTEIAFNMEKKTGIILLSNAEDDGAGIQPCASEEDIVCKLFQYVDTIHSGINSVEKYDPYNVPMDKLFWKNNSSTWQKYLPMKLGNENFYNSEQVFALLELRSNTNASMALSQQLIAAKMNIANSCELSSIIKSINASNEIIGNRKLPILPEITYDSTEGIRMIDLAKELEKYNNGKLNHSLIR